MLLLSPTHRKKQVYNFTLHTINTAPFEIIKTKTFKHQYAKNNRHTHLAVGMQVLGMSVSKESPPTDAS